MSPRRFTFQFSHLKAVCIKEKLKPWCWFELECCAARVNKILHIYHLKSERFVRFHKNPTVIQSYFFRLHQMFTACVIMYLCVQRDLVLLDAITVSLMSLVYIRIVTGAVRLICSIDSAEKVNVHSKLTHLWFCSRLLKMKTVTHRINLTANVCEVDFFLPLQQPECFSDLLICAVITH